MLFRTSISTHMSGKYCIVYQIIYVLYTSYRDHKCQFSFNYIVKVLYNVNYFIPSAGYFLYLIKIRVVEKAPGSPKSHHQGLMENVLEFLAHAHHIDPILLDSLLLVLRKLKVYIRVCCTERIHY